MAFAETFKALSDPVRRQILELLKKGPLSDETSLDREDRYKAHYKKASKSVYKKKKAFLIKFLLAVHWLCAFITARDPKKQNISPKMYTLVLWIAPLISMIVAAIEYPVNLGYQMDITFYMELLLGVLFVIIGNYLPKARQNYTIGIKIPWTLANEENWNRTHRLAGYLWMICGILMIIACLTRLVPAEWLIGLLLIMVLVPCIYSYWLHAKKDL